MPYPQPSAVLELLKPITWFPPMWAFGCGAISSLHAGPSATVAGWDKIFIGVILSGPLVCATSQAVNDWFDRDVDAINEPLRPIPSGRIPGDWGFRIAVLWTALSLLFAVALGPWGLGAAVVGLLLAWAYSAPPLRLKQNGWWGNSACAICYEGLAWFTGAAVVGGGALPGTPTILLALLYSFGAHGIMTLNDFKSVDGDRRTGINSLPVLLGVDRAARIACLAIALAQAAVVVLLLAWDRRVHAVLVLALLVGQAVLMTRLVDNPRANAPWYNGTGILLYVLGMLISALAIRDLEVAT